jgi:hypothetical protein
MTREWGPIKDEGIKAFLKFQEEMLNLGGNDQKWTVELKDVEGFGSKLITAKFHEKGRIEASGTDHQAVTVSTHMARYTSSGELWMRGNEAWEFERAEKVGIEVASILTPLLEKSGLKPMRKIGRQQEGRSSHWYIAWDLYPSNHPKALEQQSGGKQELV